MKNYSFLAAEEPSSYQEPADDKKWQDAMEQEFDAIEKNKTWKLTPPPPGCRPIGVK